ncbi:hypothetical protein [Plantactinospora sp. B24E8]
MFVRAAVPAEEIQRVLPGVRVVKTLDTIGPAVVRGWRAVVRG